jgi:hypothetical protein
MSFSFDILTILILTSGLLVVCERLRNHVYMYVYTGHLSSMSTSS